MLRCCNWSKQILVFDQIVSISAMSKLYVMKCIVHLQVIEFALVVLDMELTNNLAASNRHNTKLCVYQLNKWPAVASVFCTDDH